jgi:sugar/nucleoside kinase (ribokinase family)
MLDGRLPEPAPGGRVHGHIELRPGGSAVNVALAAARLGARAAVVGRIGADSAGRVVAGALEEAGVEVVLARDPGAVTGCAIVVGTGIVADPGASANLSPDDLPADLEADAVVVSGYSLLHRSSEKAARAAFERARGRWIAVDAASASLVSAFGAERFFEATRPVNVLLANVDEARVLTGLEAEEAAAALGEHYRVACVKLGREGAVASFEGTLVRTGTEPVETDDTLGAGDAFAAGFLVALTHEARLERALEEGCLAATRLLRRSERRPSE